MNICIHVTTKAFVKIKWLLVWKFEENELPINVGNEGKNTITTNNITDKEALQCIKRTHHSCSSLLNIHQKGDTDKNIRRAFNRKLAKNGIKLEWMRDGKNHICTSSTFVDIYMYRFCYCCCCCWFKCDVTNGIIWSNFAVWVHTMEWCTNAATLAVAAIFSRPNHGVTKCKIGKLMH